jgi:hypothetical protein
MIPIHKIEAVQCLSCEKIFPVDSHKFISVHGNINIGIYGGIVGDNFSEDGTLKSITIYCKNCFKKLVKESVFGEEVYREIERAT